MLPLSLTVRLRAFFTALSVCVHCPLQADEGLCALDTAAIVTPPPGLEFGYVPIVLYEGVDQPPNCDEILTPPLLPPPPPPPPPSCPVSVPVSCEEKCVADGHCCTGTVSSYETTSCAQGCIVAENVESVSSPARPPARPRCLFRARSRPLPSLCHWHPPDP